MPPCILSCMGLTYLGLSCNSIEELPAAIGDLLVRGRE